MSNCACCSGLSYADCCQDFIQGKRLPQTPEVLMRSRYTAYTQIQIDYIKQTMCGSALEKFEYESSRQWAESIQYLGLEILETTAVSADGVTAHVEYIAHFLLRGKLQSLHERSEFQRQNEVWFYVDGKRGTLKSKVGRNSPCFCLSGLKFKKCCALKQKSE